MGNIGMSIRIARLENTNTTLNIENEELKKHNEGLAYVNWKTEIENDNLKREIKKLQAQNDKYNQLERSHDSLKVLNCEKSMEIDCLKNEIRGLRDKLIELTIESSGSQFLKEVTAVFLIDESSR